MEAAEQVLASCGSAALSLVVDELASVCNDLSSMECSRVAKRIIA